jgi:hypothetical protein
VQLAEAGITIDDAYEVLKAISPPGSVGLAGQPTPSLLRATETVHAPVTMTCVQVPSQPRSCTCNRRMPSASQRAVRSSITSSVGGWPPVTSASSVSGHQFSLRGVRNRSDAAVMASRRRAGSGQDPARVSHTLPDQPATCVLFGRHSRHMHMFAFQCCAHVVLLCVCID